MLQQRDQQLAALSSVSERAYRLSNIWQSQHVHRRQALFIEKTYLILVNAVALVSIYSPEGLY